MTVVERITTAITTVEEARRVPLSASCVVHRSELLEILDEAQAALPADLAMAQQIIAERDQVLEEARQTSDLLIERAREEVAQMIEQTQIVSAARKEAARILDEVASEAAQEREEIENYIDSRLATLEVVLNKTLDVVQRGREKLQGADEKSALAELRE